MTAVLLATALLLAALLAAAARSARHELKRHPPAKIAWRWLTGMPWHGREPTDARWLRRGYHALTRTNYATPFYYQPRLVRAAIRLGCVWAVLAALAGLAVAPAVTEAALCAALAVAAGAVGWRVCRELRGREVRREVLRPLHERMAADVGVPLSERPRRWLAVPPDRSTARVYLPDTFDASPKALEAVTRMVTQTVFVDNAPDMTPCLSGRRRYLDFRAAKAPPPPLVLLDPDPGRGVPGLREAIEQAAWHEIVLGYGTGGTLVKRSLGGAVPHWGLSMPTGDGKSVCAELIAAQMLYHGAIGLILDYKVFSHPWALFRMPNMAYAGTTEQIHLSLLWLKEEAARRKGRVLAGIQMDGEIHGDIGPVIFVVAEELNATVGELKAYWRSIGGTGPSPAVEALREMLFVGRALRIHFLLIAQKLTVAALGGKDSAARENCAGIVMGGSSSPPSWKMLAEDVERPAKQTVRGRHYIVSGGAVELCQFGFLNPKGRPGPEARQLALAGMVTPVPEGIPEGIAKPVTPLATGPWKGAGEVSQAAGQNGMRALPAPVTPGVRDVPVGLAEAVHIGIVSCSLKAIRMDRYRDPKGFPAPAASGSRGEKLYNAAELHEYDRVKRGDRRDAA